MKNRISVTQFISCLTVLGLFTFVLPGRVLRNPRLASQPAVMLWAWERYENMRPLTSISGVGVAFLAATIELKGDGLRMHPRSQPILMSTTLYGVPVIRIEANRQNPPSFSQEQILRTVDQIMKVCANPYARGLQIDFDATRDQRKPYRELLSGIRSRLPVELPLSITALASWCSGDYWMQSLPVDEIVPMYFDMGVSEYAKNDYLNYVSDKGHVSANQDCQCGNSLGVSISESVALKPTQYAGKKVYLFSPHSWILDPKDSRNDIGTINRFLEATK